MPIWLQCDKLYYVTSTRSDVNYLNGKLAWENVFITVFILWHSIFLLSYCAGKKSIIFWTDFIIKYAEHSYTNWRKRILISVNKCWCLNFCFLSWEFPWGRKLNSAGPIFSQDWQEDDAILFCQDAKLCSFSFVWGSYPYWMENTWMSRKLWHNKLENKARVWEEGNTSRANWSTTSSDVQLMKLTGNYKE